MQTATLPQPLDSLPDFVERPDFVDRRCHDGGTRPAGMPERRQFQDARTFANPDAAELAEAVDRYKLTHRRRFITYEELHAVIVGLGYQKG